MRLFPTENYLILFFILVALVAFNIIKGSNKNPSFI